MPTKSQWLLRVPEILAELASLPSPLLDRSVIEKVFEVRRRRAIELLNSFGGYQTGKMFLIDRLQLIARLEKIRNGEEFQLERQRRARLVDDLERHRKLAPGRKVKIGSVDDVHERVMNDLPAGVHLKPGELRIEFFGTEDLLRHLYELSQAILNDFKKFQQIVEEPHLRPSDRAEMNRLPRGSE